jgi:hypothetical protein
VKRTVFVILAGLMLAGCEHKLTLDEAQAKCDKQGGLLTVIYTQKVTLSGPEPEVSEPGNCVSAKAFDKPVDKPAPSTQKPADKAADKPAAQ